MQFTKYFKELGFNEKESIIFLNLYKLGTQPASVIAKYSNLERTYVYKVLLKLCDENLVSTTTKNGVKSFFIPDINILKKYVKQKQNNYKKLEEDYQNIETELLQFNKEYKSNIPKITIFDNIDGLKNIYEDIYNYVKQKNFLSIKFFASNTFESNGSGNEIVKNIREIFFQRLNENKIILDTFLGNGISLMENLGKTNNILDLQNLPASNSSINIIIAGSMVYIIIFKDIPTSLKIDNEELAFSLHFILEHLK
ncbi:MAG: helix-turn-helix domain-containing protein [Candidatus Gracilibacteria bacterium]|nr:helix-turn-helix domain-containing protein [Candidatus Gracilibacteria bacterium]